MAELKSSIVDCESDSVHSTGASVDVRSLTRVRANDERWKMDLAGRLSSVGGQLESTLLDIDRESSIVAHSKELSVAAARLRRRLRRRTSSHPSNPPTSAHERPPSATKPAIAPVGSEAELEAAAAETVVDATALASQAIEDCERQMDRLTGTCRPCRPCSTRRRRRRGHGRGQRRERGDGAHRRRRRRGG